MTNTLNKYKNHGNNVDVMQLVESRQVIIVHPDQHIIAKIVKCLGKTK